MPERRTARTGRRTVVRERPGRRADSRRKTPGDEPEDPRAGETESEDALPDEDREPEDEAADEEPQDQAADEAEEEPADEEHQPLDDEDESEDEEPEPAGDRDASRRAASRRDRDGGMSAAQAARSGLRSLADLIGKRPEGVTAVEPTDDGWRVGVEVVEDQRVPSTADVLAIYEAELDAAGRLLSYRRIRRYPRGRGDDGGERLDDIRRTDSARSGRGPELHLGPEQRP